MAAEGFKFTCPFCSQHIRAYDEHIGEIVTCPTCQADIVVPDPYEWAETEYVVESEQASRYSSAEMQVLAQETPALQQAVLAIARENCWELAVLGEMLNDRLEPLRANISRISRESFFHEDSHPNHADLFRALEERFSAFISVLYSTYDIFLYDLPETMRQDSLVRVVDFANKVGEQVRLIDGFHQGLFSYSLPNCFPYPRMQQVMVGWAPHYWLTLEDAAQRLRTLSARPREEADKLMLQISISPPSLHRFFVLRQQLIGLVSQAQG